MRILLIKTSSLGDVVHNLPVVTDLHAHFPTAEIDWVVEESFADIPRLHPGVRKVIPVAVRRWRRALASARTWREIRELRRCLQNGAYTLAIDSQGLLKSALIARMANTRRCGYAPGSAREPFASRVYDTCYEVPRTLHAVERNRRLAALATGTELAGPPDYGIAPAGEYFAAPTLPAGPVATGEPTTAVLLTASSRDDKLWPEAQWVALGQSLHQRGLQSLLPAGNAKERERATRIAAGIPQAQVLPPSSLRDLAVQLAASRIVVGVDTGLVHLGAALGRPTLALFCASDPLLTGVLATSPVVNLGTRGQAPALDQVLAATRQLL